MKGECFVGSGGRFAGAASVLSEASESLPGCECFVGSVGKFAGAASVLPEAAGGLPEAAGGLPEVQVVCPRRRELP